MSRPGPDPTSELTALLPAVIAGDPDAVRRFVLAVGPQVLRVVRRALGARHPDIEDIAQEALYAVLEALPSFRGQATPRHFVWRVTLFTALNARRRLQLRERISPQFSHERADEFQSGDPGPPAAMQAARRRRVFEQLLDELPAAQAEALALHCMLGYTVREVAEASGAPVNTVRGRLLSAKAALRRRLAEDPLLLELMEGAS